MNPKKIILIAITVLVTVFIAWYFSHILFYLLLSTVLSLMGRPLVRLLKKVRIKNRKIADSLCALSTLFVIWMMGLTIVRIFLPLLAEQARKLSEIDVESISQSFAEPLQNLEYFLGKYNILENSVSLETKISSTIIDLVNIAQFSDILTQTIAFAGSIFITLFAVSFVTFFLLKDEKLLMNVILTIIPIKYHIETKNILSRCRKMLTRYFLGLCIDLTIVISLISLAMHFIGLENALMIGFFAGIMNIVPYLGPIIGGSLGLLLGVTANLHLNFYSEMVPLMGAMMLVFIIVNLLDAMIFQPTIYGKVVNAHPLEIFLVIMIASSIAGIPGMILAIPCYTIIRVIAKEFLSQYRLVDKLTEKI